MNYVNIFLDFLGSLGLFLFGMYVLSSGLQKSAGNRMKKILEALTKNRYMGVLLGAGVTAIIQSSSATTVMVVGFVNAGIMNLSQSIGVIMGANIGTTVTGWLVSSIEWSKFIKPATIAPIATAVGAFMLLFAKKKNWKQAGEIIVGLGMLFLGMTRMPEALGPLAQNDAIRNMFVSIGSNPLLGILAGLVITGIIQSSSVSVGILQSLAFAGLVPWNAAVYIIMGQNIGTCVTALLSSLGASRNAKSASYMHLMFNVIGTVIFSILAIIFFTVINPAFGQGKISITEISIVHTCFNIATTVLLFPFADNIINLAAKMTKAAKSGPADNETVHLDDRVLTTPAFALQCSLREIIRLAGMAYDNLKLAAEALLDRSVETAKVYQREESIDSLEEAITAYLVKICNTNINEEENVEATSFFHTLSDIERVGDHAENIAELADAVRDGNLVFSDTAKTELDNIITAALASFHNATTALAMDDKDLATLAVDQEADVDGMKDEYRNGHIIRLQNGECNIRSGVVFLETLNNLERVTDHAKNIAETVLDKHRKKG